MAYNYLTGNNKIKLLTEYTSNAVLSAVMFWRMTSYLNFSEFLDMHFPGRWVGRHGPKPWSSRSPDIMPLDFFLWGIS
jgi:hypothetical protein